PEQPPEQTYDPHAHRSLDSGTCREHRPEQRAARPHGRPRHLPTENVRSTRATFPCLSLTDTVSVAAFSDFTASANFHTTTPWLPSRNLLARFVPAFTPPRSTSATIRRLSRSMPE